MSQSSKVIRMVMPQWQGGNNVNYKLGAELLAWLAPKTDSPTINISVSPTTETLELKDGIIGKEPILKQVDEAVERIHEHSPEKIVMLGGDCLVDLAPFAYLSEKNENLGILWVDAHPDIMTAEQFSHSHAHVLGMLMGNGDADFTKYVKKPVPSSKVMIAGINDPTEYEKEFIAKHHIRTASPEAVRAGTDGIAEWIKEEGITHLAIHWDLDVLDYNKFRALLFSNPDIDEHHYDGVGKGKLLLNEAVKLINDASQNASVVGIGITEHLPWDAINLKGALEKLPLLNE